MLTYEITATVEPELAASFERYMRETHIKDVVATGCFARAFFMKSGERYLIRYETDDMRKLDDYLKDHAAGLRADFLRNFPAGIQITRTTWELLAEITGTDGPQADI